MNEQGSKRAIRDEYVEFGSEAFYAERGAEYRNPHEDAIRSTIAYCHREWTLDLTSVLDLACGSGEVTLEVLAHGAKSVAGVDPYTGEAYLARTGIEPLQMTFEEVAAGDLGDRQYSLIVCSYALHLLERSRLPGLLWQLSQRSSLLLILSPHKRPEVKDEWGWRLKAELYHQRVRARLLASDSNSTNKTAAGC